MQRFLVLIGFLLGVFWVKAQHTLPPYKQYTLRDGLSQMQITCMIQDSRGYIWIGTKEGLNCFNGEKFRKFTRYDGLANDYIYQLLEDKTGNIWISTGKGLACFDGEKIKVFVNNILNPGIALDNDGKVWYYGRDEKFNGDFGYLENGKYISKIENFKTRDKVFQIGLLFYVPHENRFFFHHIDRWYSYLNGIFESVSTISPALPFQTSSGRFYLASENADGWIVYEAVNGKAVQRAVVKNEKYVSSSLTETITLSNFIKSKKYEFRPDSFMILKGTDVMTSATLTDSEGNQWIGTEEGVFKKLGDGFTTYSRQHLPSVWGITEDLQGAIWFSSFTFGLRKLADDKLTTLPLSDPKMGYNLYFHPSVDKRGRLFFTNYNGTVVVDGKSIYQKKNITSISSFYDQEKDLLFLGDHDTAKVFSSDLNLVRKLSSKDSLQVGANVLAIQKDKNGYYWFAGGRGIARYDWASNQVHSYSDINGRFKGDGAWSIRNDYRGRTWFGTKQGLYWYDSLEDSLKKLDVEELSGTVNLIESIDSTWLIASQLHGIYLIDLQKYYKTGTVELHLFNEKNGFQGIEPGQDGAFTDSKGNVWMTTSTEVVKLDPRKLRTGKHLMIVRIDKCNGEKLPFNNSNIQLSRNQNSAVITFDAICFNRPNPVEYAWKLETDTAWSAWQTEDYAVISGLHDGHTKIIVRARVKGLPFKVTPEAEATLVVNMAIYRQPWFFPALFGFFAVLSLLVFLLFIRTRTKMMLTARQSKVFQVQAIQSQMNPHFIFNVLASFQTMILSLQTEKANQYLVKLSRLIRGFLDASSGSSNLQNQTDSEKGQTLQTELELISGFVEFQQLIYPYKFDYIIETDSAIDLLHETIPPMILQPFVENAIRHGLLLKNGKGTLKIAITRLGEMGLRIIIEDNGVGIEKAGKMLTNSPFRYESKGTMLTLNRIKLLNELGYKITIQTDSSDEGTKIEITILNHEQRN